MPRKKKLESVTEEPGDITTATTLPPPPAGSDQSPDQMEETAEREMDRVEEQVEIETETSNSETAAPVNEANDMVDAMNCAVEAHRLSGLGRRIKTYGKMLPCKLSPDDLRQKGQELATLLYEEMPLERGRQAQIMKELKATMTLLEKKLNDLAMAIKKGEIDQLVDVDVILLPGNEFVSEVRSDTGDPVNTRVATDFERQGEMFEAPDIFNERQRD